MKKATFPVALILLLFLLGCLMTLPGIQRDLEREQWCRENGYIYGIMQANDLYYCASRPVPILLPDYLQD